MKNCNFILFCEHIRTWFLFLATSSDSEEKLAVVTVYLLRMYNQLTHE